MIAYLKQLDVHLLHILSCVSAINPCALVLYEKKKKNCLQKGAQVTGLYSKIKSLGSDANISVEVSWPCLKFSTARVA